MSETGEHAVPNVTVYGGRRVPSRFCTTRGETHELCMRPDVGEETVEVNVIYNTEVAVGVLCVLCLHTNTRTHTHTDETAASGFGQRLQKRHMHKKNVI